MRAQVSSRLMPLKFTIVANIAGHNLQYLGTKRARKPLREFLAIATYEEKDLLMRNLFYTYFRIGQKILALIKGRQFRRTILCLLIRDVHATLDITTPSFSEVHTLLHAIAMVENEVEAKSP